MAALCLCGCLRVLPSFPFFNQLIDIYETWYECNTIGGHTNFVLLNFELPTISGYNMADARTAYIVGIMEPLNLGSRERVTTDL